jgi:hypothetical protein
MSMPIFDGPPPEEIKLSHAPLARVIGQVRFPMNLALAKPDEIAGFQKAIRHAYPMFSRADGHEMVVAPDGSLLLACRRVDGVRSARDRRLHR